MRGWCGCRLDAKTLAERRIHSAEAQGGATSRFSGGRILDRRALVKHNQVSGGGGDGDDDDGAGAEARGGADDEDRVVPRRAAAEGGPGEGDGPGQQPRQRQHLGPLPPAAAHRSVSTDQH